MCLIQHIQTRGSNPGCQLAGIRPAKPDSELPRFRIPVFVTNIPSFQSLVFRQIRRSETGRSPLTSPHYVGRQRIAQLVEHPTYRGVMGSSPIALFAVCRWTGAGNSKSSTEDSVVYIDSSMYVRKCRYEIPVILQGYRGSYVKGERTSMDETLTIL